VESAGLAVNLPFPVRIEPQKVNGGSSAGLMFTLTVYDLVTPEDLTGGRTIAGTGTINLEGKVGPIGGVQQKVIGAEYAGAAYFLSPPENYEAARAVARRIKVIKVTTAAEAIQFLRSLPPVERQP
jgi:PDZ domain-containing protein